MVCGLFRQVFQQFTDARPFLEERRVIEAGEVRLVTGHGLPRVGAWRWMRRGCNAAVSAMGRTVSVPPVTGDPGSAR